MVRGTLPLSRDYKSIKWGRFKNEEGRERARDLVRSEARLMGMVDAPKGDGADTDDSFTTDDLCDLVSFISVTVAASVIPRCTPEQAEACAVQPHHKKLMNRRGAMDRTLKKYADRLKMKDEWVALGGLGLALGSIGQTMMAIYKQNTATGPGRVLAMPAQEPARPVEDKPPVDALDLVGV